MINQEQWYIFNLQGGNVPWMLRPILNKGLNYVEDIIKFMGIKKFEELLVDDTGFTEEEKQEKR